MRLRTAVGLALVLCLTLAAAAHDFWIEPSTFHCKAGAPVKVALRVGMDFVGEPVLRDPERFERFALVRAGEKNALPPKTTDDGGKPTSAPADSDASNDGDKPIIGIDGKDPAGYMKPDNQGAQWIVYRSRPRSLSLEAAKFESYLKEEGLESIIDARRQRGESEKPGRESYSRCAKSLICVGDDVKAGFDTVVGMPLELVLENHPDTVGRGELSVRLLFNGKPLEGAKVAARAKADAKNVQALRTDASGRVRFKLGRSGAWLLTAVHMQEAPKTTPDADWESLWASLTFEVGAPPATATQPAAKPD